MMHCICYAKAPSKRAYVSVQHRRRHAGQAPDRQPNTRLLQTAGEEEGVARGRGAGGTHGHSQTTQDYGENERTHVSAGVTCSSVQCL